MGLMLGFIADHPEMAKNYNECTAQKREHLNRLWDELTTDLNSLGLPNKSLAGWRKVWADHKYKAKKRLRNNRVSLYKSGGRSSEEVPLTSNRERIVELTNLETTIVGDPINTSKDDPLLSTSITLQSPTMMDCLAEDPIPTSISKKQMDVMLSFISDHPKMARNFNQCTAQERQNLNRLWDELSTDLNAMGLPNKSSTGWRKVWAEQKYKTKKKLRTHRMSFQKTGEITLTPNQELIVELANLETAISGDPNKTFEDDTLPFTSGTTRSPNMMDSSGEDDIPGPARKKRKWASHNEIAEKINTRSDILDLLRDHIIGEQEYKKKKLRHQERIVQLLRERNEEERSFHSSMLKLMKEKNGLLRQIPREFESEED